MPDMAMMRRGIPPQKDIPMKLNRSAGAFARGADTVERALAINVHSDGAVSITSDQAGAKIEVDQAESGQVTVTEVLADGSTGEVITVETIAPPPAPPVPPVAPVALPAGEASKRR